MRRAGRKWFGSTQSLGGEIVPFEPELEQMRRALVLALRDYVGKNGFGEIVLGLSGGIDSALVAALAGDALGPERVHCVSMPSRYSSEGTRSDATPRSRRASAATSARSPIEEIVAAFHEALGVGIEGLAAENLQARDARDDADVALERRTAGSCSRRGTSRSSRSGTRRSTATSPAASR